MLHLQGIAGLQCLELRLEPDARAALAAAFEQIPLSSGRGSIARGLSAAAG
jgi:hypothetical protein